MGMPCEPGSAKSPKPPTGTKSEGQVLPMALSICHKISKIRSNMPSADAKSRDSRRALLKTLATIKAHKKFKAGIPELDPVAEMNIKGTELTGLLANVSDLEAKLKDNNFSGKDKLVPYLKAFEKKVKLHGRVQELDTQINQSRFMVMNDDLRAMRRVLRRSEFIDKDGVVL